MFFFSPLAEHPWLQNEKKAPNVPLGDVVRARLKQFSMMNRLKKKAMRVSNLHIFSLLQSSREPCYTLLSIIYYIWNVQVIADHLMIDEVEVIREMFKSMDSDDDGKVTFEELKAGLQKVGSQLTEIEMKMLMEAVSSLFTSILFLIGLSEVCRNLIQLIFFRLMLMEMAYWITESLLLSPFTCKRWKTMSIFVKLSCFSIKMEADLLKSMSYEKP